MNMKDEIYTLFKSIGNNIKQQFSNNNYYSFIKYHKDTKERRGAIRQWYNKASFNWLFLLSWWWWSTTHRLKRRGLVKAIVD